MHLHRTGGPLHRHRPILQAVDGGAGAGEIVGKTDVVGKCRALLVGVTTDVDVNRAEVTGLDNYVPYQFTVTPIDGGWTGRMPSGML